MAKKVTAEAVEPAPKKKRYDSDSCKAVRAIVTQLGGVTKAARALGEKQQNVNNWMVRGTVPAKNLGKLTRLYYKRGKEAAALHRDQAGDPAPAE